MNCYEDLKWRGLIKDATNEELLSEKLNNEQLSFYIGTDPTADSLHIGHLSSFLIATRLEKYGHIPYLLVGGATGRIGDPRPSAERSIIPDDVFEANLVDMKKQVEKIFGFEVVDNYEWSKDINFLDFLRDYGKHFPVNYMLSKETIKTRLDVGITYTEFSYMIMQALDFLWLLENKDVTLQVAGSDQWGNITAGVDLIRKKAGKEAFAFTMPLVTNKDGEKISKSEGKTIWLDENKTTPYELYQYFLNTDDSVVINYLKVFTFLTKDQIEVLEELTNSEPEKRMAGKALAFEVVKFVHGEEAAKEARMTSEEVFEQGVTTNMPSKEMSLDTIHNGINIMDLLLMVDLVPSKSEARRLIEQNGISVNSEKVLDPNLIIDESYIQDSVIILQKGKKTYLKLDVK